jgi:hypothetical protein
LHVEDVAGAQAETREQQKNRAVANTVCGAEIAGRYQPIHVGGGEIPRQ